MQPTEVLAELMSLSSQIEDVAILGGSGFVLGSSGTPERGEQLARVAAELLEVRQATGSVFVVSEGGRSVVATTVPEPTAGLVVYDLRTALHRLDEGKAAKESRKKQDVADA